MRLDDYRLDLSAIDLSRPESRVARVFLTRSSARPPQRLEPAGSPAAAEVGSPPIA